MHSKRLAHVRFLPVLIAWIFGLVAFVFSLLSINSKEWAVRHNYDPLYTPKNWTEANIIYTLYRSPFVVCSAAANVTTVNSTTPGSTDPQTFTAYTVSCQHFKPFGFNRTSCEEDIATLNDDAATLGDTRLCQQIHYAGNFGISSTVFIGLGFISVTLAVLATVASCLRKTPTDASHTGKKKHKDEAVEQPDTVVADESTRDSEGAHHMHASHAHQQHSIIMPYLNLALLVFFSVGVITAVIAQFYGVQGLIQSAYNNGDFSTSQGSSSAEVQISGLHGPWFQGKGLSSYATCAWAFAAAAGSVAARTWRLPTWDYAV